jgi:hypothetical protein
LARKVPKAAPTDTREAVAPSLLDRLSSNEVIDAEAKAVVPADRVEAAARVATAYGQSGFAITFSNGKAKEVMDGAGVAVNILNAHAGLVVEARELVRAAVGAGRDRGEGAEAVTLVASVIVSGSYATGGKQSVVDATWTDYPRLAKIVKVLGGAEATDDYAPTVKSLGAGAEGDIAKMSDILEAVKVLEDIMVRIYHEGGLVPVNVSKTFGLYKLVKAASLVLDVERTLQIFGRVMAKVDEAMDSIRTTDLGLSHGTHFGAAHGVSPLDVCAMVELVQLKGLPAFNDDQRGEERAGKQLAQHGLTPSVIAQLAAMAAAPPKTRWDQAPKVTPVQAVAKAVPAKPNLVTVAAVAAKVANVPQIKVAQAAPERASPSSKRGAAETPPGFLMDGVFTAAMLAAVKHLESICPAAKVDVCPWYNIFGYCQKACSNECERCPRGGVCSQALLDAVRTRRVAAPDGLKSENI